MSLFLAMKKTIKGIQNWEACSRRFPIPTLLSRYFNIAKNKRFPEMIMYMKLNHFFSDLIRRVTAKRRKMIP